DSRRLVPIVGAPQADDARARLYTFGAALRRTGRPLGERYQLLIPHLGLPLIVEQRLRAADTARTIVEVGIEPGKIETQAPVEQVELRAQLVGNVLIAVELRDLRRLQWARIEPGKRVPRR